MSRQLRPIERITRLVQVSLTEVYMVVLFILIYLGYLGAKTVPNLQPSLQPIENLFSATIAQWKSVIADILSDSSVVTNITTLVVWGLLGGVVYIILWSIYALFSDLKQTHEVLYLDKHPSEYKTIFLLLDMLLRRLELVIASVALVVYVYIWTGQIVGYIAIQITDLILFDVKVLLIAVYILLIAVSIHVFFILVRIITGQHHKLFSS